MHRILFPGSFDPLTVGHFDLLQRASRLCDELIVAVLHNPKKRQTLPPLKRVALIERAAAEIPSVRVIASDALLVDVARQQQVQTISFAIKVPLLACTQMLDESAGTFRNEHTDAVNTGIHHI